MQTATTVLVRMRVLTTDARLLVPKSRFKVDAPPYQTAPTNNADFEALVNENPRSGTLNKVYVRVRNRGPRSISSVSVKLHWSFAGTGLPALPTDFWTAFPTDSTDTTQWKPLGVRTISSLNYSGASAAGCPGRVQPPCGVLVDNAQIVTFDFNGPPLDLSQPNPRHYCLMAITDSTDDPVSAASKASFTASPDVEYNKYQLGILWDF